MINQKFFEAISALQKSVRRAEERDAGYWFFWLARASPTGAMAAFNRLRVIAHEDIGLADPMMMLVALKSVDDGASLLRDGKNDWVLCAANAVMALCRAKKCRLSDHFQAACRDQVALFPDREIPDVALDKHTARGRRLGRGFEHFVTEGTKLVPEPELQDPYKEAAAAAWLSGRISGPPRPEPAGKGRGSGGTAAADAAAEQEGADTELFSGAQ